MILLMFYFLIYTFIKAPTLAASVPVSSFPPSPLDQRPRRRHRRTPTIYTPNQLASMESMFACNQYPDINSREALADAIDVTESRVQVRFKNYVALLCLI